MAFIFLNRRPLNHETNNNETEELIKDRVKGAIGVFFEEDVEKRFGIK